MDHDLQPGIEVVLSRAPTLWRYSFRPDELRHVVRRDRQLMISIQVLEDDRADASPGRWLLTLHGVDEASAESLEQALLSMKGCHIEVGEQLSAVVVSSADILLCRGLGEDLVREHIRKMGLSCRRIEYRVDGLEVYFIEGSGTQV